MGDSEGGGVFEGREEVFRGDGVLSRALFGVYGQGGILVSDVGDWVPLWLLDGLDVYGDLYAAVHVVRGRGFAYSWLLLEGGREAGGIVHCATTYVTWGVNVSWDRPRDEYCIWAEIRADGGDGAHF